MALHTKSYFTLVARTHHEVAGCQNFTRINISNRLLLLKV